MTTEMKLCGRAGLARILMKSESTTRNLQAAGKIRPEMVVGGRPLFSVEKALLLRTACALPHSRRTSEDTG